MTPGERLQAEVLRVKNDKPSLVKIGDIVYRMDVAATEKERKAKALKPEEKMKRRLQVRGLG